MTDIYRMGALAVTAKYELQKLTAAEKNQALQKAAEMLCRAEKEILAANEKDLQKAAENGMAPGMQDRLRLTKERIFAMAEGLRQIAELPDCLGEVIDSFRRPNGLLIEKKRVPIGVIGIIYESRPNVTADAFGLCFKTLGEVIDSFRRPNGLLIEKKRVPIGVIGIIYESRPNVTADAFGLCFKTGNAVILKGGSDALCSNMAIVRVLREALSECGVTADALQLIESADRSVTGEFMKMNRYVDLLIPRGGAGLIRSVVENSTIPVIETGTGNCHIYVDKDADLNMAVKLVYNAKTQRIGVCNACESLVVHSAVKEEFLPKLAEALRAKNVELRGDEETCQVLAECIPATQEDYGKEYLDYILSVKTVESAEEAIAHINRYNTGHSECIVTENEETAEKFLNEVDAACVYVNASTRFTDGFEFGFGAEIGISTQKLHARGPMGIKELTSYKYTIRGTGQTRG